MTRFTPHAQHDRYPHYPNLTVQFNQTDHNVKSPHSRRNQTATPACSRPRIANMLVATDNKMIL